MPRAWLRLAKAVRDMTDFQCLKMLAVEGERVPPVEKTRG